MEELSLDGGFVRVVGKGDRERLVPVGDIALDWLKRWLAEGRPALLAIGHVSPRPRWAAVHRRPRPPARSPAGVRRSSRRLPRRQGSATRHQPAHAPALVRNAPPGGRGRPADRPGVARTCEYQHDPAVHAPDRRTGPRGLRSRSPASLRGRHAPEWPTSTACWPRASGRSGASTSTGSCSSPTPATGSWRFSLRSPCSILRRCRSDTSGDLDRVIGFVVLALVAGGLLYIGWQILRYVNEEFVVTTRRVLQLEGVINKRVLDSSLEKINDAVLSQSLFGRMFGFGDLDILTASETGISRLRMLQERRRLQTSDARGQARIGARAVRGPAAPIAAAADRISARAGRRGSGGRCCRPGRKRAARRRPDGAARRR